MSDQTNPENDKSRSVPKAKQAAIMRTTSLANKKTQHITSNSNQDEFEDKS